MSETKKFLYVNRKAPYGTIYALESLEVVLIGAAFEQDVSLAFLDDGGSKCSDAAQLLRCRLQWCAARQPGRDSDHLDDQLRRCLLLLG